MIKKWISLFKAEDRDFTIGNLRKNMWILAIPMILEMVMQGTFGVIDMFWVGRLGPEAIAAVSMASIVLMVVFALGGGVSVAAGAMVARRVGEKKFKDAADVIAQALYLSLLLSTIFGFLGWYFTPVIIRLLGAQGRVIALGNGYLEISFLGCGTVIFLFVINSVLRGAGHAFEAMTILGLSNLVNIILDPLLIFGWLFFPKLGVAGAAYGTVFARGIGVLIQLQLLFKDKLRVYLKRKHFRQRLEIIGAMIKVAVPGSLQLLLRILSTLVIMRLVAFYGTYAVAAYGIGLTVFRFVLLPSFGLGNAASTLVGQNLGAGSPERAEKSAWYAAGYNMSLMCIFALVFFLVANPIVKLFNTHPEVVNFGVYCVRIFALSFVFIGLSVVMQRAMMGAGDTVSPMVINALTLWVIQIPLAIYLSNDLGLKTNGIWYAILAVNALGAILAAAWFKLGWWKHKFL